MDTLNAMLNTTNKEHVNQIGYAVPHSPLGHCSASSSMRLQHWLNEGMKGACSRLMVLHKMPPTVTPTSVQPVIHLGNPASHVQEHINPGL